MKYAVVAVVAMMALATTQSDAADDFDGTLLRDLCVSNNQHEKLACLMFISGFAYGLSIGTVAQQRPDGVHYCPPKEVSGQQAELIVEKYLKDNPDKLREKASLLAYVALMKEYHCPTK
jgi:hypothetical protein